jgi:hypothetical protein
VIQILPVARDDLSRIDFLGVTIVREIAIVNSSVIIISSPIAVSSIRCISYSYGVSVVPSSMVVVFPCL